MKRFTVFLLISALLTAALPLIACETEGGINSYKITVELNEETMTLSGGEEAYYYNDTDTSVRELKFNLYANAYREGAKFSPVSLQYEAIAYPNGKSYGNIEIENVSVSGEEAAYEIGGADKNVLIVTLPTEIFPSEGVTVEMEFTVKLANVNHRLGYSGDIINLGNFYPVLCAYDNGFYECAYYPIGDPFYSFNNI